MMAGNVVGLLCLLAGAVAGVETLAAGGGVDAAGGCVLAGAILAGFFQSR